MIRKLIVSAIAVLVIALLSVAFITGLALGLAFVVQKLNKKQPTPNETPTSETPIEVNPHSENPNVDIWENASKSPSFQYLGEIHLIDTEIPTSLTITPKLLPPARKAITQTTHPTTSVTLEIVADPWETPLESSEISCTSPVSVLTKPVTPLLLTPAKEVKSKASKKTKNKINLQPTPQLDLSKLSRDALKQKCRELKIPRYSAMNKNQMIAAINAIAA